MSSEVAFGHVENRTKLNWGPIPSTLVRSSLPAGAVGSDAAGAAEAIGSAGVAGVADAIGSAGAAGAGGSAGVAGVVGTTGAAVSAAINELIPDASGGEELVLPVLQLIPFATGSQHRLVGPSTRIMIGVAWSTSIENRLDVVRRCL